MTSTRAELYRSMPNYFDVVEICYCLLHRFPLDAIFVFVQNCWKNATIRSRVAAKQLQPI